MELLDIRTKVTRIEGNTVVVKCDITHEGNTFEAHGTAVFDASVGISGAVEIAEDIAVKRAKKLAESYRQ